MNEIVLEAKSIKKAYHSPAEVSILKDVNLSISRGESIAIMGRSGEGKTTLLHILGTLEKACAGNIKIGGENISQFNKTTVRNQKIGFIFQSFHLLEDYTALENVLMPARIGRQNVAKDSPAYINACKLLEDVGLGDRIHFRTKQLSGGEKQRVAIARALCNDPDLLLADEPSGNLDGQTSKIITDILFKFVTEHNKALIVVTHDPELAQQCDRQYQLISGTLVQS